MPSDILDGLPFSIPCNNEIIDKLMNIYVNRQFVIWQDTHVFQHPFHHHSILVYGLFDRNLSFSDGIL